MLSDTMSPSCQRLMPIRMIRQVTFAQVQVTLCVAVAVRIHSQAHIVWQGVDQAHLCVVLQQRDDGTSSHKDTLLGVWQRQVQSLATLDNPVASVPVVPIRHNRAQACWEGAVDTPDVLIGLR